MPQISVRLCIAVSCMSDGLLLLHLRRQIHRGSTPLRKLFLAFPLTITPPNQTTIHSQPCDLTQSPFAKAPVSAATSFCIEVNQEKRVGPGEGSSHQEKSGSGGKERMDVASGSGGGLSSLGIASSSTSSPMTAGTRPDGTPPIPISLQGSPSDPSLALQRNLRAQQRKGEEESRTCDACRRRRVKVRVALRKPWQTGYPLEEVGLFGELTPQPPFSVQPSETFVLAMHRTRADMHHKRRSDAAGSASKRRTRGVQQGRNRVSDRTRSAARTQTKEVRDQRCEWQWPAARQPEWEWERYAGRIGN